MLKKVLITLALFACVASAQLGINIGAGPSSGLIGIEYSFLNEHLTVNAHYTEYSSKYTFTGGIGIVCRFNGLTGPYVFHSSDWIHGEADQTIIHNKGRDNEYSEKKTNDVDYWHLTFGIGYQHMFLPRVGLFIEAGSGFYAGNGGYYMHFEKDDGTLDSDDFNVPAGIGLVVLF